MSTAQLLVPQPTALGSLAPLTWFVERLGETDPTLSLPAPTVAHVSYWAELCGTLSDTGVHGVADDAWPADLTPTRSTLRALEDRAILTRRDRA